VSTALRIGFAVSGLLHVAAVTAFSISTSAPLPANESPQPLTLRLAVFEPPVAQGLPPAESPIESVPPRPDPVVSKAPEPQPVISRPHRVASVAKPKPKSKSKPKPRVKPKPKLVPKPSAAKMIDAEPREFESVNVRPPLASTAVRRPVRPEQELSAHQRQHYLAALAAQINRRRYYPKIARRRGEQGRVVVSFVVSKYGELSDMKVVESSGIKRLDEAALKTLRRASPFKPIPTALDKERWSISVPIEFKLRG